MFSKVKDMKLKIVIISILLTSVFLSCQKDDTPAVVTLPQKKDYQTQYNEDIVKIENYLKTHSISVVSNPGFSDDQNVSYDVVPNLDVNSIWGTNPLVPKTNVFTKLVTVENVVHKIYYLKLQDGVGISPNTNNQIKAYYKCILLNNESTIVETGSETGVILKMNQLILGWQNILPEFKMGTISGSNQYSDFGVGIMFLPSALAYYDNNEIAKIPAYSVVGYNFKLFNVF